MTNKTLHYRAGFHDGYDPDEPLLSTAQFTRDEMFGYKEGYTDGQDARTERDGALATAMDNIEHLELLVDDLKSERDVWENKFDDLKADFEAQDDKIDDYVGVIDKQQDEISELEMEINGLNERISFLEAAVNALEASADA